MFIPCLFLFFAQPLAAEEPATPIFIGIEKNTQDTSLQERWIEESVKKIHITGRESALDLGCGEGTGTAKLAHFLPFGNVIGIDIRSASIAAAQKRFGGESFSHLYFIQADPQDIAYKEEFDIIVSFSWFHLVKNQKLLLKKIYDSLKPNGIFVMRCFADTHNTHLAHAIDNAAQESEWKEYFRPTEEIFALNNPEQLKQLVKEAGFTTTTTDIVRNHEIFITNQIFIDWMRPWIEAAKRPEINSLLFSGIYERFAKEVLRSYLRECPSDEQGYIHLEDCEIQIEAKKK